MAMTVSKQLSQKVHTIENTIDEWYELDYFKEYERELINEVELTKYYTETGEKIREELIQNIWLKNILFTVVLAIFVMTVIGILQAIGTSGVKDKQKAYEAG
jgi:adenine-specific DNA methylase